MHQNRASPFASDFHRRRGYRREFRNEDQFYPFVFIAEKNRGSLAICFAEEIAHLGASKSRAISPGAAKKAAATAENRAILVHSELEGRKDWPMILGGKTCGGGKMHQRKRPLEYLWTAPEVSENQTCTESRAAIPRHLLAPYFLEGENSGFIQEML